MAYISLHDVDSFIADQLNQWRPATAAVRYRSLKQLFKWLVRSGQLATSPMQVMQPPRIPDDPIPVISDHQLDSLFRTCIGSSFADCRDEAILRMMLDTGARLGEITHLKVEDIDLDPGTIVVCGKGGYWRKFPSPGRPAWPSADILTNEKINCRLTSGIFG